MAVKLSSLKNDLKKERDGEWIKAPSIGEDVEFFVRSTNLPAFEIARSHGQQRLARKYKDGNIPQEDIAQLTGSLAVEHLLIDWKGLVDDDEQPIPYSRDMAEEVLTDPAHRVLRGAVYVAATQVGVGEVEYVENTSKNSGAPSGSNSSGRAR